MAWDRREVRVSTTINNGAEEQESETTMVEYLE